MQYCGGEIAFPTFVVQSTAEERSLMGKLCAQEDNDRWEKIAIVRSVFQLGYVTDTLHEVNA
jgi:hypothetical protein